MAFAWGISEKPCYLEEVPRVRRKPVHVVQSGQASDCVASRTLCACHPLCCVHLPGRLAAVVMRLVLGQAVELFGGE